MTYMKQFAISIFSLTLMAVTGCTERGEPPSLAKRPFETAAAPLPIEAVTPTASNAARAARISSFLEQARKGKSAFNDFVLTSEKVFSSALGASVSSEPWINAQVSLSRLEALRGPVQMALADLDDERRLLANEQPSEDGPRLNLAQQEVDLISHRQAQIIARLTSMLKTK
jgi:hypothetical protein